MSRSRSSYSADQQVPVPGAPFHVQDHFSCFICNTEVVDLYEDFVHVSEANAQHLCDMFKLPSEFNPSPLLSSGCVLFCLTCGMKVQSFNVMLIQLNSLISRMEGLRREVTYQIVQSSMQQSASYLGALRQSFSSHLVAPLPQTECKSREEPFKPYYSPEIDARACVSVVVKEEPVEMGEYQDPELQAGSFLFQPGEDEYQHMPELSNDPLALVSISTQKNSARRRNRKFDVNKERAATSRHIRTKKVIEEKQYFCDKCDKSFTTASNLYGHKATFHQGEYPNVCAECGKGFGSKGNLRSHVLAVHRKQKPFTCTVCFSSFSLKGNLKAHMRIHDPVKYFSCEICGKQFSQNVSLLRHRSARTCRPELLDFSPTS